ncbi:DEAD/DEAH box helicase [Shewanella surugensis]|uniref:DEAD/DEAH box helicase n=1 Tax=Shewanella surugensis TaxID=212020 RepID=A0ABT0LAL6_9GAMM|nr:DEAD/DEAH box helicase [Shewanella surugensis]MCL1124742.1 DEAD/DEAH box helicase [Shewanella surugensis]
MSFSSLGLLPEFVSHLSTLGYASPTPIQSEAIPAILAGQDVLARAQTGTGKTAAFTLPILQQLASNTQHSRNGSQVKRHSVKALILTPTRELAIQVQKSVDDYAQGLALSAGGLTSVLVYGGVSIDRQAAVLQAGVDIVVATPGRLLDHVTRGNVHFNALAFLVLDEADRMLDLGFKDEINKILKAIPKVQSETQHIRQTLLFSATFNQAVFTLSKKWLNEPILIEMDTHNTAAHNVEQIIYQIDSERKTDVICHLVNKGKWQQVLIFCRKKQAVDKLVQDLLKQGIPAQAFHGDLSQGVREEVLAQFKQADIKVLVATDVAARGLDVDCLNVVINYELPFMAEDYVHRIGRTGRAGNRGKAITLYSEDDALRLEQIEILLDKRLPQQWLVGFEPDLTRSESTSYKNTKAAQKKRARKRALGNNKR